MFVDVRSGWSNVFKLVGPLCHRAIEVLVVELIQNDLWAHANLSGQDSSAPTVQFGQTSSSRKSPG